MAEETPELVFVEEDELLAEITSFRLELLGFRVRTVPTGRDAIKTIHDRLPNAVIVDMMLPDMEGVEFINRLCNEPRTSDIPILAFSVEADLLSVEKAHAAGAKDYLVAPYDPAILEEKLEKLLTGASVGS